MVSGVGNILNPVQSRQLTAMQNTVRILSQSQLRLASGKEINSAIDNPSSFFTARSLDYRAQDLLRLLDGIGQNLQVIKLAQFGVEASMQVLDQAESYLEDVALDIRNGLYDNGDPIISSTPATGGDLTATVQDVLNANPEAAHLGGGVIVHTYTNVGTVTFTPPDDVTDVDYLIVGGGGGGGTSTSFSTAGSGGGGGGGVLTGTMTVTNQSYDVIVGAGGATGAPGNNSGSNGGNSSFGVNTGTNLIALGGGAGVGGNGNGQSGGSGGGGRGGSGGSGLQPGTAQGGAGNPGGSGPSPGGHGGGGGGGAGSAGGALSGVSGGAGGAGLSSSISGAALFYGAGGGGGGANGDAVGVGGSGVGGNGANDSTAATSGAANTGSGGGGGNNNRIGAAGADGVVILRYTVTADLVPGTTVRLSDTLEDKYAGILNQLDLIALDSGYKGIDLLDGDNMTTFFNEGRTSSITTSGLEASSAGLGLEIDDFTTLDAITLKLDQVREARETLRSYSASLANDLNVIRIRETSVGSMINILKEGRDDLTLIDQNEEGARLLAAQTRRQIQVATFTTRQLSIADFI